MLKRVANLKDSVSGILTGTNLNNVTNLYGALERTARELIEKADIPEAGGAYPVTLFSGVYDYPVTDSIYGAYFLDFRPKGLSRNVTDYPYRVGIERFDRTKKVVAGGYNITFDFNNGVPYIRVASTKPIPKAVIDTCSEADFTLGGSASDLLVDQVVFYDNDNALRFTLTGASSGTLSKSFTSIDLSSYEKFGTVFIPIWTPSATNLTSVELRLGSDNTNYYTLTTTQGFMGAFTENDWTLLSFDLSQTTKVGTPDMTKTAYVDIIITHAATLTNFRIGGLWASLPSPHEIIYQSAGIFLPEGQSSALTTITNDNDQIILTDSAYVLYEYECALTIALQMGGTLASGLINTINQKLHGVRARNGVMIEPGLYDNYASDNPSQSVRQITNWYD